MDIVAALTAKGIRPIILDESDSKFGAVETRQEAARAPTFSRSIASSSMESW